MARQLYVSITGLTNILDVNVSLSHSSGPTTATATAISCNLNLGDRIYIDLGYTDSHTQIFQGYVKSIQYNVPEQVYQVTAYDDLIRAADNFIVSTNPTSPLSYRNILDSTLVGNLLTLSGLTNQSLNSSSFTFGINNSFEINQVSAFDFCRTVTDLLTYHLWCDQNGVIHMQNRKPFVMIDSEPQIGWVNDTAIDTYTWSDELLTTEATYQVDERNLRNRVVVYGAEGIFAEAKDDDTLYYKWKTALLGAPTMIDSQTVAQNTADYNLHLFNKITEKISATVIGDNVLLPYRTINVNSTKLGIDNRQFYIYGAEHRLSAGGYIVSLDLRG